MKRNLALSASASVSIGAPSVAAFSPSVAAFSLVELIVVIGIIALLIALLLPVLSAARIHARTIACQSNLHQIGLAFAMYGNRSGGWVFPPSNYGGKPKRWPSVVFSTKNSAEGADLPILHCPADEDPKAKRSYLLNEHISRNHIRFGSTVPGGRSPSQALVMGEKRSGSGDSYMSVNYPELFDYLPNIGPYTDYEHDTVEEWRHGLRPRTGGSNYLFLDLHVERRTPWPANGAHDPWGFPIPAQQ